MQGRRRPSRWPWIAPLLLAWAQLVATAAWVVSSNIWDVWSGLILGLSMAVVGAMVVTLAAVGRMRDRPPSLPQLVDRLEHVVQEIGQYPTSQDVQAADALADAIERLMHRVAPARGEEISILDSQVTPPPAAARVPSVPVLTRSGLFDMPARFEVVCDSMTSSHEFQAMQDMIVRLDPRTLRCVDANPVMEEFLGWTPAELRRLTFLDVVHPDHRELAREQLLGSIVKGESHGLIYRIRTARSGSRAVEVNVSVRYAPDTTPDHLRCHVTDVTDRLRASKELRRRTKALLTANEELLRTNRELRELKDLYSDLYQNAPAMYFSLDEAGIVRECNKTLLDTLGYNRDQIVGKPYVLLVAEWRRPSFETHFAEFHKTGRIEADSRWIKANGEMIDVWVTGTGVFDPDGVIRRSRSVAQDMTARKVLESQLQDKNTGLAHAIEELSLKNKELDSFSHLVSHDLQEPLRTLGFFSETLKEECGDLLNESGRRHLEYVIDATLRMRAMVRDLLKLSQAGRSAGDFAQIDLNAVVRQVCNDFAATITARSAIVQAAAPLLPAWGDRDRIAQVVANLISNSLKYSRTDLAPLIQVRTRPGDDGGVVLSIQDNGIGIDPAYHAQIFQIFRRLHAGDEFDGTGAGLAICLKIVQAHRGTIRVDSQAGQGSTFSVALPPGIRRPERSMESRAMTARLEKS